MELNGIHLATTNQTSPQSWLSWNQGQITFRGQPPSEEQWRGGQDVGEIDNSFDAHDMAMFIENAGKGAMVTMKEMNSPAPIENFLKMIHRLI